MLTTARHCLTDYVTVPYLAPSRVVAYPSPTLRQAMGQRAVISYVAACHGFGHVAACFVLGPAATCPVSICMATYPVKLYGSVPCRAMWQRAPSSYVAACPTELCGSMPC